MIFTLLALALTATADPVSVQKKVGEVTRTPVYVEQYVRIYFSDIPELAEVARCESHFRHYDKEGNVLRGKENRRDVGVMQINEDYHLDTALEKEINLYTLEGNLEYARALYEKMGLEPWKYSKKCWEPATLAFAR